MLNVGEKMNAISDQGDRLRQARIDRGFKTAREACDRFGWNLSTYQQHENGTRGISRKAAMRYSQAFKRPLGWLLAGELESPIDVFSISVNGFVAAGHWLEADQTMDAFVAEDVSVPAAPGFAVAHQFAVKVMGQSLNKVAQPDDVLVCADVIKTGVSVGNGDLVVVRRTSVDGARHEYSAKRYVVQKGARPVLMPESTDPRYQKPLPVEGRDGETVEIVGKVLWIVRTP